MRFYHEQHQYYCGIDLHARSLYVCILDHRGSVVLHKKIGANPSALLQTLAPFRPDVVVAVECTFTWYWLADLCDREHIPFVLGHALYMKAIHGGKAKNDRVDSHKIAVLLRGGMMPMAYIYPSDKRATRDLLRRRMHLMRKRAELNVHVQNTISQYNLPPLEKKITYKANRASVPERFDDPSVRASIELNLALMDTYDDLLRKVELHILSTARQHEGEILHLLQTVPGIGKLLALTILYEIGDIERFSTVQDFVSYARLVKPQKESGGKILGHGGAKIGNAHLKWAFSEAAVLFLRNNPEGQHMLARIQTKHGKGKALSILAHKLGRAVFFMLKRRSAFDQAKFLAS